MIITRRPRPIFECPHCGIQLPPGALVRPVRITAGQVCPNCYKTVPDGNPGT